ncbi:hypothetical protein H2201_008657 [Coniosporium apollinis]|uniref:Ankyrin repeat protein n=1 Tax=Coniosporium apollinis TaxID=61459 RepID=A0ABQ9NFN7_9PEZI|nr:hypothetical protein H2201_008657 [Coniosporium apollinis]
MLNVFNSNSINSSQARIEQMLRTFIDEVRTGKREGSVVSTQTTGSLSADEKEAWRQLRKELESVGITPMLFAQHRAFIVAMLQKAIIEEGLAGDIPYTYDSSDFLESGQEGFEALSTPGVTSSAEPNAKHTNEPLQQPIQDRISSKKVPNIDSPKRSKNVGRMARLLFKITNSRTAIVEAARSGDAILVERLLDKGAAMDSKDNYGWTPLLWAAEEGREAVVKLLLDKGAVVDSAVVKLLLDKGAVVDSVDEYDKTPLSWAAEEGREAMVRLLLDKGAAVDSKDNYGQTPLSWAAWNGHEAVVKLLRQGGGYRDCDSDRDRDDNHVRSDRRRNSAAPSSRHRNTLSHDNTQTGCHSSNDLGKEDGDAAKEEKEDDDDENYEDDGGDDDNGRSKFVLTPAMEEARYEWALLYNPDPTPIRPAFDWTTVCFTDETPSKVGLISGKFYAWCLVDELFDARLYGPILFVFAVVSTILNSMQVEMAVEQMPIEKKTQQTPHYSSSTMVATVTSPQEPSTKSSHDVSHKRRRTGTALRPNTELEATIPSSRLPQPSNFADMPPWHSRHVSESSELAHQGLSNATIHPLPSSNAAFVIATIRDPRDIATFLATPSVTISQGTPRNLDDVNVKSLSRNLWPVTGIIHNPYQ